MWLPPYFGSYEHLLNALLHNPFIGSGGGGVSPLNNHRHAGRDERRETEQPDSTVALAFLVTAAGVKDAAAGMTDKSKAEEIVSFTESAVADFLDGYCGTPWPHHWPGPPPWWVSQLASQLTLVASALQPGALKSSLNAYASQALDISVANSAGARQAELARR
jgi:hypothetical protein